MAGKLFTNTTRRIVAMMLLGLTSAFAQEQTPTATPAEPPSPTVEPLPSPEPLMMKAVRVHTFGGLDVLQYEDAPRPTPGDGEILIRVLAAGVNPIDARIRAGESARIFGTTLPFIPGLDVAGTVEETGVNVTKFKPGDAVYACLDLRRMGGYAEFAIAQENEASPKPKNISFEGAASMPVAAGTAYQALIQIANLSPGETVLIHGAAGGVGSFAIQIAKARGAKVIATASAANQDFLKELGADQTIDYQATKFEDVAKDVDVVLDAIGGETLERSYGVVKKGGIIVTLVDTPDKAQLDAHGIRGRGFMASPDTELLGELTQLVEAKKLRPVVTKTYPLGEAAKAQEAIESGHTRGKIVLHVADEPKG